MQEIWLRYTGEMSEIGLRYDWDMHDTWYMPDIFLGYVYEICLRHVWDTPDNVYKILYMPEIYLRFKSWLTE